MPEAGRRLVAHAVDEPRRPQRDRRADGEHAADVERPDQQRDQQRPGERAQRVLQAAHDHARAQLTRGGAERRQQRGVRRPEEREGQRGQRDQGVRRDGRLELGHRRRGAGQQRGADQADRHQHALARARVDDGRGERREQRRGQHPGHRDHPDGGRSALPEGQDPERDGDGALGGPRGAERDLGAAQVRRPRGLAERRQSRRRHHALRAGRSQAPWAQTS